MSKFASFHHPAEADMTYITDKPIDIPALFTQAHHAKAGGIVLFSGEVRNHHKGKGVNYLEYEAFIPMAEKMMKQIVQDAIEKWQLEFASCVHRIGKLDISESAVVVITSHGHRQGAYEANQYIIDRVKSEVPIWKKEFYEDGSAVWTGNN